MAKTKEQKAVADAGTSKNVADVAAITSSLSSLDSGAAWRGCVDAFTGTVIRGWALVSENLTKSVVLEISICDIVVLKTFTRLGRNDISKTIGLPVKAGFQVSLHGVATETVAAVMDKLKKIGALKLPLKDLLTVQIAGTDIVLPLSSRLRQEDVEIAPLIAAFDSAVGMKVRNEYIGIRDKLLASSRFEGENGGVRAIAYYLPQFHPFPENDEWWGTGFTEWTNVISAKPYLPDHHQPHLPADFGFYDLRVDQIHEDQIALAKKYSVSGFCYYYYWFSGKTLMTMPIDRHLEKDYDFEFCLCWANENWSRRWDGSENDVLMAQRHVAEDDVAFIHSCLKYFKSPRYIKIDGAPLLQVYRISHLERPKETIERWRSIVKEAGFPDLHVSMVESFGLTKPYDYGCDSSSQFPPHGTLAEERTREYKDLDPAFEGKVYDYTEIVRSETARPAADHIQFRTAMPSWDNTSRKGASGTIFHGSSPELFESWLIHLANNARENLPENARFIFINAWNEWAEGAHLEPDRKYGHAWLQAVRSALTTDHAALVALAAPPDGAVDPHAVTRPLVERLVNANTQLRRLLQPRYGQLASLASTFARVDEEMLTVSPAAKGNRAWIESLNWREGFNLKLLPVSTQQGLVLSGWVQAPELAMWNDVPFFVGLKTAGKALAERYAAMVFDRSARSDVVDSLKLSDSSLWCGFYAQISLRDVPPGRYEIEIIVADAQNLNEAYAVPANLTLLIG